MALFMSVLCFAQQQIVTIYLNNGHAVSGCLQNESPTTVTIQKSDGEIQTINKIEIRKIGDNAEEPLMSRNYNKKYIDYSAQETGFWCAVELGSGVNIHVDNKYDSSIMTDLCFTGGYQFNKFLQIGAGAGVRYYFSGNDRVYVRGGKPNTDVRLSFPVYANVRGLIVDNKSRVTVPYWSANIGYTIKDGFSFAPSIGLRIGSMERYHFLVSVGYALQCASALNMGSDVDYHDIVLNALTLKVGFQF